MIYNLSENNPLLQNPGHATHGHMAVVVHFRHGMLFYSCHPSVSIHCHKYDERLSPAGLAANVYERNFRFICVPVKNVLYKNIVIVMFILGDVIWSCS